MHLINIITPFISGLLLLIFHQYRYPKILLMTSTFLMCVSVLSGIYNFIYINDDINIILYDWIHLYTPIYFSVYIDSLSKLMGLIVSSVSCLVHIYSISYMDKNKLKFNGYLSLFTFLMLVLVYSQNLLQLFLGWEGVGLFSYLLINFYNTKKSANKAAIKAFIVNRVADIGLIASIVIILLNFKTLNFNDINNTSSTLNDLICFLLLIGSMGKSAQILLHVWLPDAMEGPTPVSALIHAATMVTAGIFLIVRLSFFFDKSPMILTLMTFVGATTAVFGGFNAILQHDIKKIIAYSTCSQLGYMFLACGLSGYGQAMFHLTTHAFFKALLFLSAGNVIYALHHEQNIYKMGGLRKMLPFTFIVMIIGSLAITGIPPFAGFYSKDAIISLTLQNHSFISQYAFFAAIITVFFTSIYSWKIIMFVFYKRANIKEVKQPSLLMKIPLFILGLGSTILGIIWHHHEYDWHGSIVNINLTHDSYLPLLISIFGMITAYIMFYSIKKDEFKTVEVFNLIYQILFVKTLHNITKLTNFNESILVKSIQQIIKLVAKIAENTKFIHNGNIQNYLHMMFFVISIICYLSFEYHFILNKVLLLLIGIIILIPLVIYMLLKKHKRCNLTLFD